jgi:hypothetical protein
MVNALLFLLLLVLPLLAVNFRITFAVASAMADTFDDQANLGTAAVINIYDGTVPAEADTALGAQVLLAQLVMSATAFGAASNGVLTAAAIADDASADATGTATFFRILTQSGGTVVAQGTVGTAAADLILNTVAIQAGAVVSITSATVMMPRGS